MMKKLNDYTIKEIEALLEAVDEMDETLFTDLSNDPRKGVQKLVSKKIRQFEMLEQANKDRITRLKFENELWQYGFNYVAGVDEVGRGPLAGPVYAASVILPKGFSVNGINDSKQLSHDKRITLYDIIIENAIAVGVGSASVEEIDQINIKAAARLAMKRSVEEMTIAPEYVLVDAEEIAINIPQKSLIKGDATSYSIGAASIVAKVVRDNLMAEYAIEYPGYDFEKNMGYGTKKHLKGLEKHGVTPIHRKSFAPVKQYLNK